MPEIMNIMEISMKIVVTDFGLICLREVLPIAFSSCINYDIASSISRMILQATAVETPLWS